MDAEFVHTLNSGKVVLYARITRLLSGKYAVETKTIKGRFEINMNIPLFDTKSEAKDYLLHQPNWKLAS